MDKSQSPHPTEPLLEAILTNQDKNAKSQESVLEAILVNQDSNAKSVEPILEASLLKQDETVKAVKELTDKLEPKELGDGATFIVKGIKGDNGEKGDKGEKGDTGDKGEKGDSIKGDKGEQGIKGLDGKDGKNGKDGRDGLDGRDGVDGKDGAQGPAGKDGKSIDPKDVKRIAKELNKDNNLFLNIPGVKHIHAGTNVTITGTDEDPIINATGGSGGGQVNTIVAGTGITVNSTDPANPIVTNSSPDQTVSITAGTNITSVTGTYPNFTINAATQSGGSGITRSVNNISSDTTGAASPATDYIYNMIGSHNFTLPTAISNTNTYDVKAVSGTTTVLTTSAQTINGSSSITISAGSVITFLSDGSNWNVI